ncbi:Cytochrome P450 4V2 [Halotydeus destructor]|nr:Cytochrome P450 4V2 [Halotydeus destructor]
MSFIQLCSSSFVSLVQKLPLVLFVYIVFRLIGVWRKLRHRDAALSPVPGPPARWPLIGNLDLFWDAKKGLNFTIKERLTAMSVLYEKLGIFKLYIGLQPVVYLFKPNTVQAILSNAAVIDKSHEYSMVECWLGKGLGTRNGDEWRTRRKVLGPAFHFTVLQDFIPIINEQSRIFCQVLQNKSDTDDISQLSINCALDIICETALGVKLNTQREPLNAYAKALHRVTEIFVVRILSPWLWPDMVFFNLPLGREMTRQIAILHAFTRGVIRNRKNDLLAELQKMSKLDTEQLDTALGGQQVGTAKRLAFLDMLIKLHMEGVLTEEEVREEVDMFTVCRP